MKKDLRSFLFTTASVPTALLALSMTHAVLVPTRPSTVSVVAEIPATTTAITTSTTTTPKVPVKTVVTKVPTSVPVVPTPPAPTPEPSPVASAPVPVTKIQTTHVSRRTRAS